MLQFYQNTPNYLRYGLIKKEKVFPNRLKTIQMCPVSIEGISKFNWILQTFGAKSFWAYNTSSWIEDFSIQLTIEVTEQPPIF